MDHLEATPSGTRGTPSNHGRRRTDYEPHRGWRPVVAIALATASVDWLVKAMVVASLPEGAMVELVEGRVAFWHVKNPAMVLGLFGDLPLGVRKVLAALLAVVMTTLLLEVGARAQRLLPARRPWAWLFIGLAMGGMLGNMGERAHHWLVTDFLSFRIGDTWLPPGNVADVAIFLSIPIAILVIAFEVEARSRRQPSRSSPGNSSAVEERLAR